MTNKQEERVKRLKVNETVDIGRVKIKRDRGQYLVVKDDKVFRYKIDDFYKMSEKVDELNTEVSQPKKTTFQVEGTNLIVVSTQTGYEVFDRGKLVKKDLTDEELQLYLRSRQNETRRKEVEKVKKEIVTDRKVKSQKKVLYYFILILSVVLLSTTYILGIKFDGITIKRSNQELFEVITEISNAKHPEKKLDKFDAVYFTLNYYAHQENYFMLDVLNDEGEIVVPAVTTSGIYKVTSEDLRDKSKDNSYSGHEFNLYFKDEYGHFVNKDIIIARLGYILGRTDIESMQDLILAYLEWDANDEKSNRAYNWERVDIDGSRPIDTTADYWKTYLTRNRVVKIFLNSSSKFIHEYSAFESLGWLTWTGLILLILYIILAISIWIFKEDKLKTSKGLVITIVVAGSLLIVPLILQYFFEGLNKEATAFLDIVENTRFTTTTTLMNFVFHYIMKFSNIVFTGVLTIILPLKVIRYFVLAKIKKLENQKPKGLIDSGRLVEDIGRVDWRLM